MKFTINEHPCLLLETAELVFSLVNQLPAERLTCDMPYAIPAGEVERIRQIVCENLDPENEELRFFFQGIPITVQENRPSCLACSLLYCHMCIDHYEIADTIRDLKASWHDMVMPFKITGMGDFSFSFSETDTFTSLSREIRRLPVPVDYQMDLVEVFSNFDYYVDRLGQLLYEPAERLKPLLEPWVTQAGPRRQEWAEFLCREDAKTILLRKTNISSQTLENVNLTLRYFSPQCAPGELRVLVHEIAYHMGVALLPGQESAEGRKPLQDWEYNTFRLIASPDCVAVLRATTRGPRGIQELSQEMEMNPGSVFRHVNNLYNAGLLQVEVIHNRNYYTANLERLKKLMDHLLSHLDWNP